MRWRDVDLDRDEVRVSGQLQDGDRTRGKTKHAHQAIPISADLVRVLECHLQNQEEEHSISPKGWNSGGYVFCTELGTPFNPANIWCQFDALQRRAGLCNPCAPARAAGRRWWARRTSRAALAPATASSPVFAFTTRTKANARSSLGRS